MAIRSGMWPFRGQTYLAGTFIPFRRGLDGHLLVRDTVKYS